MPWHSDSWQDFPERLYMSYCISNQLVTKGGVFPSSFHKMDHFWASKSSLKCRPQSLIAPCSTLRIINLLLMSGTSKVFGADILGGLRKKAMGTGYWMWPQYDATFWGFTGLCFSFDTVQAMRMKWRLSVESYNEVFRGNLLHVGPIGGCHHEAAPISQKSNGNHLFPIGKYIYKLGECFISWSLRTTTLCRKIALNQCTPSISNTGRYCSWTKSRSPVDMVCQVDDRSVNLRTDNSDLHRFFLFCSFWV